MCFEHMCAPMHVHLLTGACNCRDLTSREAFGQQDPFVTLELRSKPRSGGAPVVHSTAKSGVVKRGGSNPVWVLDNVLALQYVLVLCMCVCGGHACSSLFTLGM